MAKYGGNINFPTPFCKEDKGKANHYPQPKISRAKLIGYHVCRELMAVAWGSLLTGGEYNPLHHGAEPCGNKPSARYDAFLGGSNVYLSSHLSFFQSKDLKGSLVGQKSGYDPDEFGMDGISKCLREASVPRWLQVFSQPEAACFKGR